VFILPIVIGVEGLLSVPTIVELESKDGCVVKFDGALTC
jgi:hypothetical protein